MIDSNLQQRMAARMDELTMRALYGQTAATTADMAQQEPFTLDKLREIKAMFDSVPPPPLFASSVDYPREGFWTFELDGREAVIGHPSLWEKVPAQAASGPLGLGSIPIVDTDNPINRELAGKIRFRILTAERLPGQPPKWPKDVLVPMRPVPPP